MGAIQQMLLAVGSFANWVTTVTGLTTGSHSSGWSGWTMRQVLDPSVLQAGTKLRFTLKGEALDIATIGAMYVQIAASSGDPYDYDTTPVQVFFGGSATYTLSGAASVVTDEINLAIDGTRPLVLAWYFNGSTTVNVINNITGTVTKNYNKNASDAATVNATGYVQTGSGVCLLLFKVEVLQ